MPPACTGPSENLPIHMQTKIIKKIFAAFHRKKDTVVSFEDAFHYRPDDFVIVSYPKSGSTWLRFIIANLIYDGIGRNGNQVDFLSAQLLVPEISEQALANGADFNSLPPPRILRSHSAKKQFFPNVIYLLRDGRDVLVSYYYHFAKFNNFKGTISEFISSNLRKSDWHEHVNSWLFTGSHLSNLYILRYENMILDPLSEVRRLLSFVGLNRTVNQVNAALQSSTFDKMRALEQINGLGYVEEGNKQIRFVRAGKIGQWRKEFTERDTALIKEKYGDTLIRAGYETSHFW